MFASKDVFFTNRSGAYSIARSVRLRSSASAYLNRTPASATNTKTWTWSGWFKNSTTAVDNTLIDGYVDVNNETVLRTSGNQISFAVWTSGAYTVLATTPAVFRDPSAWYHIVFSLDTTQATNSNGVKLYVNGVQQTFTFTNYTQNATTLINSNVLQRMGRSAISGADRYTDGYLTEINFIDGQALTSSSFGSTNTTTGVWQPIKYTGTYGTNGFYLNFSDNSAATAAAIGKDYSGNGNNWTPNNINLTSSSYAYDSMLDVPTMWADGGNGRGNYAVGNPLNGDGSTWSNGNLNFSLPSTTNNAQSGFGVTAGKWYWEVVYLTNPTQTGVQQIGLTTRFTNGVSYSWDGSKYVNGANTLYGASFTTGDVIGVALDMDGSTVTFYKNNVSQGAISTSGIGMTIATFALAAGGGSTNTGSVNFGQRPFTYTPPTGFVALNTQNLPTPTISNGANYMAASTYTGTGATQSIVNSGNNSGAISFKPDFVWVKSRSLASSANYLYDSTRGVLNSLTSNDTSAEQSVAQTLTSFNSNGFTLGTAGGAINGNGSTFIGWQWQAGQGYTSSNTNGSITSTVSVNATAGFSVCTFNAGSAGNQSFGHGLGVAPSFVIIKDRQATTNWVVYHSSATTTTSQYLVLNTTAAIATASGIWGAALPTSSIVGFGSGVSVIANDNCVAYCWAPVAGYSKFGSYTGNGSADGTFVYLGFRPRYMMVKRTDTLGAWTIWDSSRDTYNVQALELEAQSSGAEQNLTATAYDFDFLSNGIKFRGSGSSQNASGGTYIFAAFAENPFRNALAR